MSYEAAIASAGGDEAALAKSLIISLEGTAANWYARLQPRSIQSWQELRKKFLLNFQGFQSELSTEEDFLSCMQYEKETLPEFCRRFLRLKAQAPEVPNDQVISQAIKALRAGQLHSHLTRERPRTIQELYENFEKFSKSEVLHFRKLEQQRKAPKETETSRPGKFQHNRSTSTQQRAVNSIDSDGCGPPENWEKNYEDPRSPQRKEKSFDSRRDQNDRRGGCQGGGRGRG